MEEIPFQAEGRTAYVSVLLPLALPKPYTYILPSEWQDKVGIGQRVEVQFGKGKVYAALVCGLPLMPPTGHSPKPILSLIDEMPIVDVKHIAFWDWLANYYCCTIGEVMAAALPAGFKLSSETILVLNSNIEIDFNTLNDKEYVLAEALSIRNELKVVDVQDILNQKNVHTIIRSLLDKKIIFIKENLKEIYKPKKISYLCLLEPYQSDESRLPEAFDKIGRADRQLEALMAFLQLSKQKAGELPKRQAVMDLAKVSSNIIKALEEKKILENVQRSTSRLDGYNSETEIQTLLSPQQQQTLESIFDAWQQKEVVLLKGVTGSGKTHIYINLINKCLEEGGQILYLLPEIALTTQIIQRLRQAFGNQVVTYHSRMNNNERAEAWQSAKLGKSVFLAARSGVFLPFSNLRYVIIDEEHDASFKQMEPAPRYQARDAAIYLARLLGAKTLLGTATPALETYHNVHQQKYAMVELTERFGGLEMPQLLLADMKQETKQGLAQSHFSSHLLEHLRKVLDEGEQAILFQNRRGYAPILKCNTCNWHIECAHCDVSLTYHKHQNNLRCHYCGYQANLPTHCAACGGNKLSLRGFGTEKIEDDLKIFFPSAKIGRMDWDTTQTKNGHANLINDFEEGRIDILVGTQMVTKGLDFDRVGMVGILNADSLLKFPDFRASERAFQLIMQVSGRAGRKHKRGLVIIQATDTAHPTLRNILTNNETAFFERELKERFDFQYPPFVRLVKITLKHQNARTVAEASKLCADLLSEHFGKALVGPALPVVPRIRSLYLMDMMLKLDKTPATLAFARNCLLETERKLHTSKGFSQVRMVVDVDTY